MGRVDRRIALIAVSLWALARPGAGVTEWVRIVLGVWLFFVPWILGFGDTNIVVALPAHCVEMCIALTCSNEQVLMPVVDERQVYGHG